MMPLIADPLLPPNPRVEFLVKHRADSNYALCAVRPKQSRSSPDSLSEFSVPNPE
jgi:hypothetical protein